VTNATPPFAAIDWSAPWFAPLAARGQRWQQAAFDGETALLAALNADARHEPGQTGLGQALAFIRQAALPADVAYETYIAATGSVPTRYNLHDFFNALIWLAFPRIKAALNARQAAAIAATGIGPARGRLRDALTLFDENAALFVTADPALAAALRNFDWTTLMQTHRAAWGVRCEARIVGHALLEKLTAPYRSCTAHAWIVEVPPSYFRWPASERCAYVDANVALALAASALSSQTFAPLPVLGIPGWWPANANPAFYADSSVFRTGRRVSRPGQC